MLPLYMSQDRVRYYTQELFPNTFEAERNVDSSILKIYIMKNEYLVFHQRITPFFIGFVLAYIISKLKTNSSEDKLVNKRSLSYIAYLLFHGFALLFSVLFAFQPLLLATVSQKGDVPTPEDYQKISSTNFDASAIPEDDNVVVPIGPDIFVSLLNRPLYASSFAYLLYRALLPKDHVLQLRSLSSILELPILQFLAKFSYPIYIVHMRVILEVTWKYFAYKSSLPLVNNSVFLYFLAAFIISYVLSLALAMVVHNFVELPAQIVFGKLINHLESVLYGPNAKKNL